MYRIRFLLLYYKNVYKCELLILKKVILIATILAVDQRFATVIIIEIRYFNFLI